MFCYRGRGRIEFQKIYSYFRAVCLFGRRFIGFLRANVESNVDNDIVLRSLFIETYCTFTFELPSWTGVGRVSCRTPNSRRIDMFCTLGVFTWR